MSKTFRLESDERLALSIAIKQIEKTGGVTKNIAAMCVITLDRLVRELGI